MEVEEQVGGSASPAGGTLPPATVTGRRPDGRFAKGNKIRPHNPGGGRPKKIDSTPILMAIADEFDPAEVRAMLRQAWAVAVKNDEWKGMLEVIRFVASYAIGKPVQRSIKAEMNMDDFINLFKGSDDGEAVIDLDRGDGGEFAGERGQAGAGDDEPDADGAAHT